MKLCVIVCVLLFALVATAVPVIQTKNGKLFVDGIEWIIKGVAYSPTPLGKTNNNGGFCSRKKNAIGQFITPCEGEDYFDGANVTRAQLNNQADPPTVPWNKPMWERDLPLMQQMGINTIRMYHTNPVTLDAVRQFPQRFQYGSEHRQFMDMCQAYGIMVIFPLHGEHGPLTSTPTSEYEELLRFQIDEIGDHPALLMYALGNELPVWGQAGDQDLIETLNHYMDYSRSYQKEKWGNVIPLTNCVVDLPPSYNTLFQVHKVDVFCTNAGYRGNDFSTLWTGSSGEKFSGMTSLMCKHKKPVFIGEFGWHSVDNEHTTTDPIWINRIIRALVTNNTAGCIGGLYFEWADEPHKAALDQRTMGLVKYLPNVVSGVGNSTTEFVWLADIAERKPIYYTAKNGTVDGQNYNYQANWFDLMGRQPATYENAPDLCAGIPDPDPSWCVWPELCGSISGNPSTGDGTESDTSPIDGTTNPTTSDSSLVDATSSDDTTDDATTTSSPATTSTQTTTSQTTQSTTGTQSTTSQSTTSTSQSTTSQSTTSQSTTSQSTTSQSTTSTSQSATSQSTSPSSTQSTTSTTRSGAFTVLPAIVAILAALLLAF